MKGFQGSAKGNNVTEGEVLMESKAGAVAEGKAGSSLLLLMFRVVLVASAVLLLLFVVVGDIGNVGSVFVTVLVFGVHVCRAPVCFHCRTHIWEGG